MSKAIALLLLIGLCSGGVIVPAIFDKSNTFIFVVMCILYSILLIPCIYIVTMGI